MSGCSTCGGFDYKHDPVAHGGEPNDGPGSDGHHVGTGECFACMVGVATGPESHGDRCPMARTDLRRLDRA